MKSFFKNMLLFLITLYLNEATLKITIYCMACVLCFVSEIQVSYSESFSSSPWHQVELFSDTKVIHIINLKASKTDFFVKNYFFLVFGENQSGSPRTDGTSCESPDGSASLSKALCMNLQRFVQIKFTAPTKYLHCNFIHVSPLCAEFNLNKILEHSTQALNIHGSYILKVCVSN